MIFILDNFCYLEEKLENLGEGDIEVKEYLLFCVLDLINVDFLMCFFIIVRFIC